MADLRCNIAGIKSPNPFWLASAPPTDKLYNVERAFKAGWGGVVWKTLGEDPPVVNQSSRYGAVDYNGQRMMGLNNIELITDRPLEVNLQEIKQCKRNWPDRAVVVSLMVPCEEESWKKIFKRVEETGADGVELNFGCPHGMSERGMGSAVGQVPEYIKMVTQWCKKHTRMPVLVKLTPNITDVRFPARAAKEGGADGVSLINTINSITSVDLDIMAPRPTVDGKGTHGGYCGPAVKPIALNMVAEIARDPATRGLPISGIGGISTWRDAAEFLVLGARSVQVCTAAMHYGFKIVDEMTNGLANWMDEKGYRNLDEVVGRAVPNVVRLEGSQHQLPDDREDRSIQVHRLRPLLHRLRRHVSPGDFGAQNRRQAQVSSHRQGMRGLQSLPTRLPGAGMHQHGESRERQAASHLAERSAQRREPELRSCFSRQRGH